MADEPSVLEQALALIPGVGTKRKPKKRKPTPQQHLVSIEKSLAKLTADVERLAGIIAARGAAAKPARKATSRKMATAKRASTRAAKKKSRKL